MTNYIIRRLLIMPLICRGDHLDLWDDHFLTPEERSALYVRDIPKNEAAMDGIINATGWRPDLRAVLALAGRRKNSTTGKVVGGILRGDFGYSRSMSQPVVDRQTALPGDHRAGLYTVIPIIGIGV